MAAVELARLPVEAQLTVVKPSSRARVRATDTTRSAVIAGLDSIEEMTGGSVVRQATETGRKVVWQMNSTVAKQILRALRG